jgi:hypothetical protein
VFDASPAWVYRFKRKFGIVSRHIDEVLAAESVKTPRDGWINGKNFVERLKQSGKIAARSGDMVLDNLYAIAKDGPLL